MSSFLALPAILTMVIKLAVLVFQGVAFVDCLRRRTEAFPAAGKWTKPGWSIVLGLAVVVTYLLSPLSFIGIILVVASIVYMVDVRPAVREISGGGRGW